MNRPAKVLTTVSIVLALTGPTKGVPAADAPATKATPAAAAHTPAATPAKA